MRFMKTIFYTLLFALISATAANAQIQHFNANSLGMGAGGTAYVDGYNANFVNPANLMLKRHNRNNLKIGFAGTGVRAGGGLVNIPVYNQYLTNGQTLDGTVRENYLSALFGSSQSGATKGIATTVDVVPLGVSYRGEVSAYSVAIRSRALVNLDFSRGFYELGLYGFDGDQFADPRAVNFKFEAIGFSEISVGYAREVFAIDNLLFAKNIKVFAGVAPKFMIATGYNRLNMASTMQVTRNPVSNAAVNIRHDFSYNISTYGDLGTELNDFQNELSGNPDAEFGDFVGDGSYAGAEFSGMAFDFGGTVQMDISGVPFLDGPLFGKKTLTVGLSFTDIGNVKFTDNPVLASNSNEFSFSGVPSGEDPEDFFDNLADSVKNDIYLDYEVNDADDIKYSLPGSMNFGAHLQMGKLSTALDYSAGYNGSGTNSQFSTLALGVEYRFFNFLPVRMGVRNGGFSSRVYTAGLGLDFRFLEFTFAAALPSKADRNGSALAFAFSGLNFRF